MRKPQKLRPMRTRAPFMLTRLGDGVYETRAGKRGILIIKRYVEKHIRTRPKREIKINKWMIEFEGRKFDGFRDKKDAIEFVHSTLCSNVHHLEMELRLEERARAEAEQKDKAKERSRQKRERDRTEQLRRHNLIERPPPMTEEQARAWAGPAPSIDPRLEEWLRANPPKMKRRRIGPAREVSLFEGLTAPDSTDMTD